MPKVVINGERCKGCGICVMICPHGVLKSSEILNSRGYFQVLVDQENKCTACLNCGLMCPDVAIEIWK